MKKAPFEEQVNAYYEAQSTEVMLQTATHIKDRLELLRKVILKHDFPTGETAQLWVTMKEKGNWFSVNDSTSIGARDGNGLILDDDYVSGNHCKIEKRGQYWYLSDLNSQNGVFVNGKPTSDHRLKDGDVIQLGDCSLLFVGPRDIDIGNL